MRRSEPWIAAQESIAYGARFVASASNLICVFLL